MNKKFIKLFFAMLITFICKRLMQQIDLIMIAPMGELELAAYSVPMSINIIDFAIYLSLAAVLTVRLSKAEDEKDKLGREISNVGSLGLWLGMLLCVASIFIYNFFIQLQVFDMQVKELAQSVVGWCAVTIIPDSACLFLSMILFIANHGRMASVIALITIVLDASLNYLFAYKLGLGFSGIYVATFVSRTIEAILFMFAIKNIIFSIKFKLFPSLVWTKHVFRNSLPEFFRIILERGNLFIIFWLINYQAEVVDKLSVFTVVISLRFLLNMLLISYARSITITLSKNYPIFSSRAKSWVIKACIYGFIPVMLIAAGIWSGSSILAMHVFKLDQPLSLEWWHAFANIFILIFALDYIAMICRSIMNYLEKFKLSALFDSFLTWGVLLPVIYLSLRINNPYLLWGSYAIDSAIFILFVIVYLRKYHET